MDSPAYIRPRLYNFGFPPTAAVASAAVSGLTARSSSNSTSGRVIRVEGPHQQRVRGPRYVVAVDVGIHLFMPVRVLNIAPGTAFSCSAVALRLDIAATAAARRPSGQRTRQHDAEMARLARSHRRVSRT